MCELESVERHVRLVLRGELLTCYLRLGSRMQMLLAESRACDTRINLPGGEVLSKTPSRGGQLEVERLYFNAQQRGMLERSLTFAECASTTSSAFRAHPNVLRMHSEYA